MSLAPSEDSTRKVPAKLNSAVNVGVVDDVVLQHDGFVREGKYHSGDTVLQFTKPAIMKNSASN
jgi:hypothetical protein